MSTAILAHDQFPERAKTAFGVLRYGQQDVVALIDRQTAGSRITEYAADLQDVPIVESMADVPECETLLIGVAASGGGFEESWRPDIRAALERGCDVVAGLHDFLEDDPKFTRLAAEHGCTLHDIRKPPDDLGVASGTAGSVDARVVLTVGTDSSVGKMTTAFPLCEAARQRGIDAVVAPTGQTGIMVADDGIPIDHVVSDFAAGAAERLILDRADHELIVVEGQGSLAHPAYSGVTTALLHGTQPDAVLLCHDAGREYVDGWEAYQLPTPAEYVELYEGVARQVAPTTVAAGSLDTSGLSETKARKAIDDYEEEIGVPATDPVRYSVENILDAIMA